MSTLTDQITNLESDLRTTANELAHAHDRIRALRNELTQVREANDMLVAQTNEMESTILKRNCQRNWLIDTWSRTHAIDMPDHMIDAACVRELLTGWRAVEQGRFEQWKAEVTCVDPPKDVAELIQQDADRRAAQEASATVGTASDGVRTDCITGENNTHDDPIAVLFSVLAQVLQSSDLVKQRQAIRFEFTKD